jgi:hypothetical protein
VPHEASVQLAYNAVLVARGGDHDGAGVKIIKLAPSADPPGVKLLRSDEAVFFRSMKM